MRAVSARGGFGAGAAHLRGEWGRWWRTEDWTDTHVAHYVLNDQYRTWMKFQQRHKAEVQQNIGLLKEQQKMQRQSQLMQINIQRERQRQGRGGYGGYGSMGASPMISYKMMQWASLQMRMGQQEFRHVEITPSQLHIGRGHVRTYRHRAAAGWILGLGAAWVGLWWVSVTTALVLALIAAAVFTISAAAAGRSLKPRRPPVPKLLFIPPNVPAHTELAAEPEQQPFPLRDAGRDPRQAREAVRLALLKERAKVAEVRVPEETAYGWKVPLVLESGTAGQLIGILKGVATTLRVGESRIMAQSASPDDAAEVVLRILLKDPFTTPDPLPIRLPGSCSIRDSFDLGPSIEGESTPVMLAGQHVIITADTGGGKTALVQRIVEFVTACTDAVVVDIDPVKRGLKVFAPLAALTARTPEEAEEVLELLTGEAKRRIAAMPATQNMWHPTAQDPAVVAVLDEFVKLSPRGKELAAELLRNLGREALISIIIVTQDATKDMLGDAIADVPGVRIMLPCRSDDVPLVVGRPNAIALGWWPHLLVPSPDENDPADAGRFYAITPKHRDPVLRYAPPLLPADAARLVAERRAAPRPVLRLATAATAKVPEIARHLLAAFATHRDPEAMSIEQLLTYLATVDPKVWTQWDKRERTYRLAQAGRQIQSELKASGLTVTSQRIKSLPNRPTGYLLADIRDALS
ncbi:hypothetical protein ACIBEA_41340 [Streptomyces sp. NPDC051555]|uniref:hypothetical protein n=1 Tax=Streptomyces sp. NPDC051555 TaxID=3365657 RepID=UPI003791D1B8